MKYLAGGRYIYAIGSNAEAARLGKAVDMVDAQPRIALPALAEVIPEREDALVAQHVGPALLDEPAILRARLGLPPLARRSAIRRSSQDAASASGIEAVDSVSVAMA